MNEPQKDRLGLSVWNFVIMIAALVIITLGYIIMAKPEISLSVILLVLAYVIIIPASLLIRFKKKD